MVNFNDRWSVIEYQYKYGIISRSEYREEIELLLEDERKLKENSKSEIKEELEHNSIIKRYET